MAKKAMLMILDGWGHGLKDHTNAIHLANTPYIDSLYSKYPNTELKTFGEFVGLPNGQMGNSEVGHLNIGAGRVVYQDFAKINKAVTEGTLKQNKVLLEALHYAKTNNKPVHFMGLLSEGGIHSHQKHLVELCNIATQAGCKDIFVHAFTDGRDTAPTSGIGFLKKFNQNIAPTNAQIVSVIGRYYAMDRDKRWERIKLAYDMLVNGKGNFTSDIFTAIDNQYHEGITDEFLPPIIKQNEKGEPLATIKNGDVVICFNFRTDRCRQITEVLTQKTMHEYNLHTLDLYYVTMTNYDKNFKNVRVLFEKENLKNTLGEVLSKNGKSQIRIAETEKYPHVTFFFSGGREAPFDSEKRILVNSPKVATYDLQPEMSADEVTEKILVEIKNETADFICLNFANPDMVGHTGDQKAIIKAVETIDTKSQHIIEAAIAHNYQIIVIADHGNAEKNMNEDGSVHTAHTTNLVPCIAINTPYTIMRAGKLADVAPTLLKLMEIEKPTEMDGTSML